MKRIGRRPFLIGSSLLGACGGVVADEHPLWGPSPTPIPTDPPATPPSEPAPGYCGDHAPDSVLRTLRGINKWAPYPPGTLYSFTTAAQVADLRQGAPIFSKSTSDSGHRGFLFEVLEGEAAAGSEPAKVLAGPMFEKGRFAWPFLTGTRISPEKYGDEIVAFRLRPEARVAVVSATIGVTDFFDANNERVDAELAISEPERIGAIYFVNDSELIFSTLSRDYCPPGGAAEPLIYREFYLGNLAMVAEWSLGTQAILDHLAGEIADLRGLAKDLDCTDGGLCNQIIESWTRRPGDDRFTQFLGCLAFASPLGPSGRLPSDLAALADDLAALRFEPDPLVVRP